MPAAYDVEGGGHVAADDDGLRVEQVDGDRQQPRRAAGRSRAAGRGPRRRRAAPAATRSRTCADVVGRTRAIRATSAQPPATASRQPVAPQRQGSPSAAVERVCPISPAAPRWPSTTRPSAMMPSPRPVEAFTTRASRSTAPRAEQLGPGEHVGVVGRRTAARRRAPRSTAPARRRPSRPSPGSPGSRRAPRRRCRAGSGRSPRTGRLDARRAGRRARSATCGISSSGPTPTAWSRESAASSSPSRSKTASWLRERPTATASTTPASGLNTSAPGGRPPVEASSSPTSSSPAAVSALTRATTAVRDRPVSRRSSERVSARPVRTSSSSSPAVAGRRRLAPSCGHGSASAVSFLRLRRRAPRRRLTSRSL